MYVPRQSNNINRLIAQPIALNTSPQQNRRIIQLLSTTNPIYINTKMLEKSIKTECSNEVWVYGSFSGCKISDQSERMCSPQSENVTIASAIGFEENRYT